MALKKIKSDEAFKEAIEIAKIQNHTAEEDIVAEETEAATEESAETDSHTLALDN